MKSKKLFLIALLPFMTVACHSEQENKDDKEDKEEIVSIEQTDEYITDMFVDECYFDEGINSDDTASLLKALNGDGKHLGFKNIIDQYSDGLLNDTSTIVNVCKYYAGVASLRLGKIDDAIDYLEDYNAKDYYTKSITLMCLGDAYVEKGDNKKAIKLYLKSADTNPNETTTPNALFKAGMCYLMLEQKDMAADCFKRIKKEYPMSPESQNIDTFIDIAKSK